MKNSEKLETFRTELNLISFPEVRKFTEKCVCNLPDYFFDVAASSTGKYHPKFSLGEGGLVRHTQIACRIANDLFNMEMFNKLFPEKCYAIAALILHDGVKHGNPKQAYTVHEHPNLASDLIMATAETDEEKKIALKICPLVESHMGQWNKNKRSRVALAKPSTPLEKFVHLCDYIASRKTFDYFYDV